MCALDELYTCLEEKYFIPESEIKTKKKLLQNLINLDDAYYQQKSNGFADYQLLSIRDQAVRDFGNYISKFKARF